MDKILNFIAKTTSGQCYKTYKYCFDGNEFPGINYDDKPDIVFSRERNGETDKGLKTSKDLSPLSKIINESHNPIFKYFLDGSRRTYKVDDIAYENRLYPIIAGQIGVGCCFRENSNSFKNVVLDDSIVLTLPSCANKDNLDDQLYFNSLIPKLNELSVLKKRNLIIKKIMAYDDRKLKQGEKYEHRGIEKIQDEMTESEKRLVIQLVKEKRLNFDAYLIKDGSLQYQKIRSGNVLDLSSIKSNYQRVVGVSKSFNPELCKDQNNKSIAKFIADLYLYHRTPAYKYTTDRSPDVEFSVWYLRIRESHRTVSPFDGILKIEKILVTDDEQENGLDSDEIDRISANLINERNPTCYGSDTRWGNHLYPVYLTESYIKSKYLSDVFFLNLF